METTKRLNKMCINCSSLNNGCTGTKIQCFSGCIYRDKNKRYIESNRYKKPLFVYDLYDDLILDEKSGNEYLQVIITQFSDETENAHEIAHKRFYFSSNDFMKIKGDAVRAVSVAIDRFLDDEKNLVETFKKPENSKIHIERKINEFYTVNGKTYLY